MGTDGFVVSHRRVGGALSALFSLTAAFLAGSCSSGGSGEREAASGLETHHFYLGESKLRSGDLAGALEHLRIYQQRAGELAVRDPANRSYRLAEAYSYSNLAAIYQRQGNLHAANENFRQSIALQDGLLATSPDDVNLKHRRAVCLLHRGLILRALGQTTLAEHVLDAALTETEAVTRIAPANADWLRDFAAAGVAAARLDLDRQRTIEAITRLRLAGAIISGLLRQDPEHAGMLRDQANVHINLAAALRATHQLGAASREIEAAEKVVRRLPSSRDHDTLRRLAAVRAETGAIAMERGDRWQATIDYEAAAGVLRLSILETRDHNVLDLWTRIMLALGRGFDARQTFARLDEMGFREPSLMALRAPQ